MHETPAIPRRAWLWVFAAYLFQSIPAAVRDEALPVALKDLGYPDARNTQVVAVFGLIVALAGCYHGMQVKGNSEEVGLRTTMAVVSAIFAVIVLDAFFAVFFTEIGWG